jgi:5-methylcytosine-specific restriction endonuclease McrA
MMGRPEYTGWYKTARWKRLRKHQLAKQPFCQCPHHIGGRMPATVADHITPHRGDQRLFWDPNNIQSLAASCHDSFKKSQERGGAGFLKGCDEHGIPLDPSHPWRQEDNEASEATNASET